MAGIPGCLQSVQNDPVNIRKKFNKRNMCIRKYMHKKIDE